MTPEQEIVALKEIIELHETYDSMRNRFHAHNMDLRRSTTREYLSKMNYVNRRIEKEKEALSNGVVIQRFPPSKYEKK